MGNLSISFVVEVCHGNKHATAKGLPGIWNTLDKLLRHQWHIFSRGDSGYGNENTMLEHEQRNLPVFLICAIRQKSKSTLPA